MSKSVKKEKLQQLLSAIGSKPQVGESLPDCADYNWYEPHSFSHEQLEKLDAFVNKKAGILSEKFTDLCRSQFVVEVKSITQHYAGDLSALDLANETKYYCVTFGNNQSGHFGLMQIPARTAIFIAKQMLGDSDSNENSNQELSQLEESLLYDLSVVLINLLSVKESYCPSNNIISEAWPLNVKETEEMCKLSFIIKKADSDINLDLLFIVSCNELKEIVGKNKYYSEQAADDYSNVIAEHLGTTPVCVTAQLAASKFSFEDMMSLQVNDIIILDRCVDEPIDLMIDKNKIGSGWPVKSEGNYAVQIASTEF